MSACSPGEVINEIKLNFQCSNTAVTGLRKELETLQSEVTLSITLSCWPIWWVLEPTHTTETKTSEPWYTTFYDNCYVSCLSYFQQSWVTVVTLWKLKKWRIMTKGSIRLPKRMNFRKSSERPFTPHPHFRKIMLRILRQKCVILRQKCVCSLWRDCYILYDHISHEMHVVQQFNMEIGWKTYPEKTIFYDFHAEKALFKGPNFAT